MNHQLLEGRHAGLLIPLFSLRSKQSWGIGDIADIESAAGLLSEMGAEILQILPINELPPDSNCPYTPLSAFAIDPIYISVRTMEDAVQSPEASAIISSKEYAAALSGWRESGTIEYPPVREAKFKVLWPAFLHFLKNHRLTNSDRGQDLRSFIEKNRHWLDDYALFRTLKDFYGWKSWTEWESPLKNRDAQALAQFSSAHEQQILFFKYLQWIIHGQWKTAREKAALKGVKFFGDMPFMVNQESADVWSRRNEFDLSCSIGAPPDDFSSEGQRWGLPAYRWDAVESSNFTWWTDRVRTAVKLYDLFRLDHVVGFFRTWIIPYDKNLKPDFDIRAPARQQERGRKFLDAVLQTSGASLPVAEDLGVIPPFVRETLAELKIPGYKILRWEKDKTGNFYLDPASYPEISLATTGTHDTDTLCEWWHSMTAREKRKLWEMISGDKTAPRFSGRTQSAILGKVMNANSRLAVFSLQDVFNLKDRINLPGTTGAHNWTFRLPAEMEKIMKTPKFMKKIEMFKKLAGEAGRRSVISAAVLCLLSASGCSMRKMAVKSMGEVIQQGMPAYFEEENIELADKSMPASLKLLEILIKNDPRNSVLLETAAQGYCGYALMFEEDRNPDAASVFYKRGENYGLRALKEKNLAQGTAILHEKTQKNDVPAVFWTVFCKAGWIQLNLDNPDALAEIPRMTAPLETLLKIAPDYYYNGAYAIMGSYYAGIPKMLGGNPEKAGKYFELSLRGKGGGFLMNKLMFASKYAVQIQNRPLFEKLLGEVINGKNTADDRNLANESAKIKAKKLMEKSDELF